MILAPIFVIYAFALHKLDEFGIVGVYSTEADALAALEAVQPHLKHQGHVVQRSMSQVMDELALARLDGLGLKLEITEAAA